MRKILAQGVAALAWGLGIRKAITLDNLRHALPETPEEDRRRVARGAYRNLARSWVEAFAGSSVSTAVLDDAFRHADWAPVERALASGKGVLGVTAHFGSWELLGELVARRGVRIYAVVRPLKGSLNAELMRARERSGLRLISARGSLARSLAALKEGAMVAMLIDQALPTDDALWVPFFGRPAATSPSVSVLARRTQAPVFLVLPFWDGGALRLHVDGPFPIARSKDFRRDIADHTAQLTLALERRIREMPEQWMWLHRRWKGTPPVRG